MKIFTLHVNILGVPHRPSPHSTKKAQQFLALILEKIFASEEGDELAMPVNAKPPDMHGGSVGTSI